MPADPKKCPLAAGEAPFACDWCGKMLNKRQEQWCANPTCRNTWKRNHDWHKARAAALERDRFKCVRCGCKDDLEVNHIYPLGATKREGDRSSESCEHHLSNLETLCHNCHLAATRKQRADGLLNDAIARRSKRSGRRGPIRPDVSG